MTDRPDRDSLLSWAAATGLDDSVVDDERFPAFPDRPLTLRQFSDELCDAEGMTDAAQREKRWKTIQRWPQRRPVFPTPEIPDPPLRIRSRKPTAKLAKRSPYAVFSAAKLYAPGVAPRTHQTDEVLLDRLASQSEPMPLAGIAAALGVHHRAVYDARDASLERLANGADPQFEIPDPEAGSHQDRGALYRGAKFAHFWRNRPGQGRRTR